MNQRALGWLVLVLGVILLGSYAVWPRAAASAAESDAPLLAAVHVPPLEQLRTDVLAKGQTLSDILSADGLRSQMANILLSLRQFVDPRRLMPGTEVTVRRWTRSGTLRALDVAVNADTTLRLEQGSTGWDATVIETPVNVDTVYIAGTIRKGQTLYGALVDNDSLGLPPAERVHLVETLADIYGYKLDFAHDIRANDSFRVVYKREARPDGTARSRRVLVADIVNQGTDYEAIYFKPRGQPFGHYYDAEGKSLRLAFRRYPVEYVRITSNFSWHRYDPILHVVRPHEGTDFGAPIGTPIMATADGTVFFVGWDDGYGRLVKIRHWAGYTTRYAHMSRFARGIHPGVKVKEGEVIGYVGESGEATGPHVHYEIRRYGRPMNPRTVKLPGAPPLAARYMVAFRRIVGQRLALLDRAGPNSPRLAAVMVRDSTAAANAQEQ